MEYKADGVLPVDAIRRTYAAQYGGQDLDADLESSSPPLRLDGVLHYMV